MRLVHRFLILNQCLNFIHAKNILFIKKFIMSYQITLPSKPRVISEDDTHGIYEIDGFYPGYGHTIGNSLRRIILSSLPGVAITQVKIPGVQHEFSTIDGIKEDVIILLLNLKKVRVRMLTDEPQVLKISEKGPKTITAADIEVPGQVEILNKDQHIVELTGKGDFEIEMTIESGLGYVPKEALVKDRLDVGSIALDAVFSPVRKANYEVENMRVGDRTDYNRLRLSVETDGTITAREAIENSIVIMIHQLKSIVEFKEQDDKDIPTAELSIDPEETNIKNESKENDEVETATKDTADKEVFKTRIEELKLSQRVESSLNDAGIRTIGGLARKHAEDILGIAGLGEKGLQEIKRAISNFGVTLRS